MNNQLKKELAIIANNNKEARKAIRELLGNNKLNVSLNKYYAIIDFDGEEILTVERGRDAKIKYSFSVYSMRVDNYTSDDIINNYADFLELSSRMMRKEMQAKINKLICDYITKTEVEINNSFICKK